MSLSLAATCLIGKASAQKPADAVQAVRTADLDLARPADVSALQHRIAVAAMRVCSRLYSDDWPGSENVTDCAQNAVREASPQIHALLAKARSQGISVADTSSHR